MGFLSNLFGGKRKQAIIDALLKGAKIIDVRTVSEFKVDHIEGAINIPIDRLNNEIKRIKKMRTPIVVCCESGSHGIKFIGWLWKHKALKTLIKKSEW